MFYGATTKFAIGSLDDVDTEVEAQFNPKELQFDRTYSWADAQKTDQTDAGAEYTGASSESVKVALLFDGYENDGRLDSNDKETVEQRIQTLRDLAKVIEEKSANGTKRRPHVCVATWGSGKNAMPRFECVIESMSVVYQAFSKNGDVLRAMVTLGLKGLGRHRRMDSNPLSDRNMNRRARENAREEAAKAREAMESQNWSQRGLTWRTYESSVKNDDGTKGDWRYGSQNGKK